MTRHTCTGDVDTCATCTHRHDAREYAAEQTDDRMGDDYADREAGL